MFIKAIQRLFFSQEGTILVLIEPEINPGYPVASGFRSKIRDPLQRTCKESCHVAPRLKASSAPMACLAASLASSVPVLTAQLPAFSAAVFSMSSRPRSPESCAAAATALGASSPARYARGFREGGFYG